MIKLVAFDWNGTLLSDTQTCVNADNYTLKSLGLETITIKHLRDNFDIPMIKYWTNLGMSKKFFKNHVHEIEKLFYEHYEKLADKTRSRAGSRDVLKWLKKKNVKAIIYSNHTKSNIERQLRRLGLEHYIETVLAREIGDISHMHNRSKELKLTRYIKLKKIKPHEVISIGDTIEEIEIGKVHHFHTVAITGGHNSAVRLKKHNPDFLIHNMLGLKRIVKQLNESI